VTFDDPSLVADAGLLLPATLMARLGVEQLVNDAVDLAGRVGGSRPGRKLCSLIATILAGGSHIDHANLLRAGATQRVLPFRVMAPSTLGTFLRSFTFGHVRQLDRAGAELLGRAWSAGMGPGDAPLTIDLDSTICEVHGDQKQGAAYGYTHRLGLHPLLAVRADSGELLHWRLRKGSSQRGHKRFAQELIARVRRAGATGPLMVRADSGFWSRELIDTLDRLDVGWSITVAQHASIRMAIAAIDEQAWAPIDYTIGGHAEVAETIYTTGRGAKQRTVRLVVRRTRLIGPQAELWPNWRHHAFITSDHDRSTIDADTFHRQHAVVELAIRDLKEGSGLEHMPSGHFAANAAWLTCAALAHNLIRWTAILGGIRAKGALTVARTMRTRFIAIAGRVVNRAGRTTLRMPSNWPWAARFEHALERTRQLPTAA
jgi:hypothetical protein